VEEEGGQKKERKSYRWRGKGRKNYSGRLMCPQGEGGRNRSTAIKVWTGKKPKKGNAVTKKERDTDTGG